MEIKRIIQPRIEKRLHKGKAIIVYGARRVGKTTLVHNITRNYQGKTKYLNCDEPDIALSLSGKTSTELKSLLEDAVLVVIDEAQRVANIGLTIKLLADNFPQVQIIATGSSSLDLANKIQESLTGRTFEFLLTPFSLAEVRVIYKNEELTRLLPKFLSRGLYPEAVLNKENVEEIITGLAKNYLYKDIFSLQKIRNPQVIVKLVQALALQIGSEVSTTELSGLLEIDKETVERYLDLLEKCFIIFRLNPFSRNLRKELGKMKKVYFWDTGIRNAVINNFNPPDLRNDTGGLWENFLIAEKMKNNLNNGVFANYYFWRTYDQKEIDFIEEKEGKLLAYEFKWGKGKIKTPKEFLDTYKESVFSPVNQNNFLDFLS